ncbi:hypothetical protein [Rhizobium nepotum]|uniref:hypothetical protein n=1 Tax=Rhizobium nepotum TaxID=1035271 RepID=UPI003CECAED2
MSPYRFKEKHEDTDFAIGSTVIQSMPVFVEAIGKCLLLWPHVEHQLGTLLAHCLKTEVIGVIAAFGKVRGGAQQGEILRAAASENLHPTLLPRMESLLNRVADEEKHRNKLAHGIWGRITNREDLAVWVDSKHYVPWNTTAVVSASAGKAYPGFDALTPNLWVYRIEDIHDVYDSINETHRLLLEFNGLVKG